MPSSESHLQLLKLAEQRLGDRLAATADLDAVRRCGHPAENLVAAVTPTLWAEVSQQLDVGNGGELEPTGGHRPKFCSAFSSSALAVNTFGPFVDPDRSLALPGAGSFKGGVVFEAQRSAGVRGFKPNLDFVVEPADGGWLFAESKCLEYLRPHSTAFSDAFVVKAAEVLMPQTAAFYKQVKQAKTDEQPLFGLVDAEQLLKHFLAAKVAADGKRPVTLAYIFWEPADAQAHSVFATHRQDAAALAAALVDQDVQMVPLSYCDVWASWDASGDPGLRKHVATLRDRYDVTLGAAPGS